MKLIILDRDGVINFESDEYIKSPDEWNAIPGSLEAIARLNKAGFTIAVATNQSGIERGLYDHDTLDSIHQKLYSELAVCNGHIEKIFYCPHGPEYGCECRKPKAGMLASIAEHFNLYLKDVPFIGDSLRDIKAAQSVDCRPLLVKTGYGQKTIEEGVGIDTVPVFSDLSEAADFLISEL